MRYTPSNRKRYTLENLKSSGLFNLPFLTETCYLYFSPHNIPVPSKRKVYSSHVAGENHSPQLNAPQEKTK